MINGAWDVLELVFVLVFWVETKGKTLEEIDAILDGEKHSLVPDVEAIVHGKVDVSDVLNGIEVPHSVEARHTVPEIKG